MKKLKFALLFMLIGMFQNVQAHSSSDSFLSLSNDEAGLVLRVDIHLRDVDLIFKLDHDRNGQVTWAETISKEIAISKWLEQGIQLHESGQACMLGNADIQASEHADGIYLSALWHPTCNQKIERANLNKAVLSLSYTLMFAQDNLHRGLLKLDFPEFQSSAIFSPEHPHAQLTKANASVVQVLYQYFLEGIWHIWIGVDHILFLISLLVLAPLQSSRARITQWHAVPHFRSAVVDVLSVVTSFTIAHSITLGVSIMKWLEPSPSLIEPAIAISVVAVALNNLLGWSSLKRWPLAFAFGLIHGFGFANVLLDLGLPSSALAAALGGFNLGVEFGQLVIVCVFLPFAWLLRNTFFYRWGVVVFGSTIIAVCGTLWVLQRTGLV